MNFWNTGSVAVNKQVSCWRNVKEIGRFLAEIILEHYESLIEAAA